MTRNFFHFSFPASLKLALSIVTLFIILGTIGLNVYADLKSAEAGVLHLYELRDKRQRLVTLRINLGEIELMHLNNLTQPANAAAQETSRAATLMKIEQSLEVVERLAPQRTTGIQSYVRGPGARIPEALARVNQLVLGLEGDLDAEALEMRDRITTSIQQLFNGFLWILFSALTVIVALSISMARDVFIPLRNVTRTMIAASKDTANPEKYLIPNTRLDETGHAQAALNTLLLEVSHGLQHMRHMDKLSAQRLSAIEAAGDGIGIVDNHGRLTYINRALMNLHGIAYEDLPLYIGKPWGLLYSEKGRRHLHDKVLPILQEKGFWRGDSPIVRRDGTIAHAEMSLTRLADGGAIGTARDVTEQKKAAAEKEALRKQFIQAQKMETVGRLTGGIAHDFNNMLTIISGNVDLLEDFVARIPDMTPYVQATKRAVERGAQLTQRLLAFSRQQVLNPRILNVNDIMPETMKLMRKAVHDDMSVCFEPGADLWPAEIDVGQLENAVLNLCINAKDALLKKGSGTITIKTDNAHVGEKDPKRKGFITPGDYVTVSVTDDGEGIPKELLNRVFEPFFTTKDPGKGTGLGLSMVYGFAKQSNGFATIDSTVGKGTCVTLYFPRSLQQAEKRKEDEETAELPQGRETILLVEDEQGVLDVSRSLLARLGYAVHTARNGPEAVLLIDEMSQLDLLMTDISMPGGIDGAELCEIMHERFPGARTLFISGHGVETMKAKAGKAAGGKADYLPKPYTREQLAHAIRKLLDSRD